MRHEIEIEWRLFPSDGLPRAEQKTDAQIETLKAAGPRVFMELYRSFGGQLPGKLVIVFFEGPVETRISVNKDGQLERQISNGAVIKRNGEVWIALSLCEDMEHTAIHEFLHYLHPEWPENKVEKATKDFLKLERWCNTGGD